MTAAKNTTDGSNSQTNEWYYWAYLAVGPFPPWLLPPPLGPPWAFPGPWALPGPSLGPPWAFLGPWALGPGAAKTDTATKKTDTAAKKNKNSS